MILPEKTIERLSQYRRSLLENLARGKTHIYSHELALQHNITAVQVRRDLMFIGYTSSQRRGYDMKELSEVIGKIIDAEEGLNVAVVGMGNLGMAISMYFKGKRPRLNIIAAFDTDPAKISQVISGVKVYSVDDMEQVIKEQDISMAILTVPVQVAVETTERMVFAGIRGILNFTTSPINVPKHVYLENYDMITSLEKIAYFVKKKNERMV